MLEAQIDCFINILYEMIFYVCVSLSVRSPNPEECDNPYNLRATGNSSLNTKKIESTPRMQLSVTKPYKMPMESQENVKGRVPKKENLAHKNWEEGKSIKQSSLDHWLGTEPAVQGSKMRVLVLIKLSRWYFAVFLFLTCQLCVNLTC